MASADQLIEVFNLAKLRPPGPERDAFLAEACGDDAELKEQILSLLKAHEKAGVFLQGPPELSSMLETQFAQLKPEKAGGRIGPYTLREQIGEGGFGIVWVAEQQLPVRRTVALKIIKLGMDTRDVVARFEQERQALALMDHPNIAKVFDAGATEEGRPYFVMELVRGIKITDYCDQANLPTSDRLALFMQVCHAVQHAHQKGIIHRDLKPSNILVTLQDGTPVPKVIDFGVAKATQGPLTELTIYTRALEMVGTPLYMSPEQAEMNGLDVDTRTDIYALGVLLYELLTGRTPFDADTLRKAGYDEVRRIIREQEPQKPSTALHIMAQGTLTTVAQHRASEPPKLIHAIRGDLDWIVMKTLEKDRSRRYETANGLAADIRRHLDNEPVMARPPSKAYQFQKLVRRNKVVFAAASAVITALVIGLAVSTWMFYKEQLARQRAVAAEQEQSHLRQRAEANERKSEQVAKFLKDMLAGVGPGVARGRDATLLREIVDKTAERISTELTNQPEVAADLRETLGVVYCEIGMYPQAQSMLEEALRLRKKLYGDQHLSAASALHHLGEVFRALRLNAESEAAYREALAIRRTLSGNEHADVASSLFGLGSVIMRKETAAALSEAETVHREALAIRRKLLGLEDPAVAVSLTGLGIILHKQGRQPEAEACMREALGIQRKQLEKEHPDTAITLRNLGLGVRDLSEGEAFLREAVAMEKKLVGEHRETAYALNFLGDVLQKQGKHVEAEQIHREALAMQRKVLGEHTDVGVSLNYLGTALVAQRRVDEGEAILRETLALRSKLIGDNHANTGKSRMALANLLVEQRRFSEAEPLLREQLAIREKMLPDDWAMFQSRSQLGRILLEQAKYTEAEPLLVSGYEGLKQRLDKIPDLSKQSLRFTLQQIVRLYRATGQSEKAAEWNKKLAELDKGGAGK
jgi:serine/threonine protein kinase/Tfp pilus assembly protein PilF